MLAAFILGLSLLFTAAASVDVVVATVSARGGVTLTLAPAGKAELKRDGTGTRIRITLDRVSLPSTLGPALNTYVVWAVSPEGLLENLGEIILDRDKGRLEASTHFDQAGVLITAEPHYMVDRPSTAVAFRTQALKGDDSRNVTVPVEVGTYNYSALQFPGQTTLPVLVLESRAALQIAKSAEADRWAEAEFRRARVAVDTMEEMISRSSSLEIVSQSANEAIRMAQRAVVVARERKAAGALDTARGEITLLKQEIQSVTSQMQQLLQQQNAANAQIQKFQADLAAMNREVQRLTQERDQAVTRDRATARSLADLQAKQENLRSSLVLQLREEFYDLQSGTLTPWGRDALARVCVIAAAVPGQLRLDGPAPDTMFEAARQYLLEAGIAAERIVLKR